MQKKQYNAPCIQIDSLITVSHVLLGSPAIGLGGSTSGMGTTPIIGQ